MCGFSGLVFIDEKLPSIQEQELRQNFLRAAQRIAHRGNDDSRTTFLSHIWLSHYRLAFQDVEASLQPMYSPDGRYVILFNGEIYNHFELRKGISEKTNYEFRTRGDTETILHGFLAYGEDIVALLEGEFAFVVLATDGSSCFAARDPSGVKPLFFAMPGVSTERFSNWRNSYDFSTKQLQFASEIKALPLQKKWEREGALRQFVGLFEPIRTPFQEVIQIPPGGKFVAQKSNDVFHCSLRPSLEQTRHSARAPSPLTSAEQSELEAQFRETLKKSVKERLLSDVELGVYLSGGIDSKAVAFELHSYLTETKSTFRPKSFTVGFQNAAFDETEEAMRFAKATGFEPHGLTISDQALAYSYPVAVYHSENLQPYTNGAAKWWLSLLSRRSVSGVLTGDGADELLCGYPSFRYAAWWKFAMRARTHSKSSRRNRDSVPLGTHWRDSVYLKRFQSDASNPWAAGQSAEGSGLDFAMSLSLWGVPHPLFGQIKSITCALLGETEGLAWLKEQGESIRSWYCAGQNYASTELEDSENALLLWQNYFFRTHLPVQVLNWVGDRMEMANSLEGRTPFLSKSLRDFVRPLGDSAMVAGFLDKAILRRAYEPLLKKEFAYTPKKQFGAPFLNHADLIRRFEVADIFEKTGLGDSKSMQRILTAISHLKTQNSGEARFEQTHLESALQTAISTAIVDQSIVQEQGIQRNKDFEELTLKNGLFP
jgi:asparagine synthase (glutamine-hydrolysing)